MARERVRWPSVVDRAREIVNGYAPMKVTLRQVMYRLVSEGTLPHTAPMYRRLSAQLAKARREGRFPDLIDTVREVHVPPAWPGADAFVAEMPDWFRLDRTEGQEHALYVAAEKDTLRQQLTGWLADAGIPGPGGPRLRLAVVRRRRPRPRHRRPARRRAPGGRSLGLLHVWCDVALAV
ncbi:hypothetical protein [Streptomyces sp. ME19-01-6]|uniref:hypothetical protein n=1 Tax=Streptomyces sp. ME19-01-6 TaxID=3028686 RepID=UPI0029A6D995|nr:hypothetical protein [Streptomyces sp. ME19-01-6]MDX3231871.1 hypothetical protein [Streptomyces sp. ME19-01-6]